MRFILNLFCSNFSSKEVKEKFYVYFEDEKMFFYKNFMIFTFAFWMVLNC